MSKIFTLAACLLLLSAVFYSPSAYAQFPEGVTQEQIDAALSDLSDVYGQPVTSEDQAKEICNLDQYITQCADIGTRHNLFSEEEIIEVNFLLDEIRGDVADRMAACTNLECLMDVATDLANRISVTNPELASRFDLTEEVIESRREIIQAANEIGVSVDACIAMDPDTAPIDLLRACARLARDSRVAVYVPEATRQLSEDFDQEANIELREALAAGVYSCGDNTLNGCGDFCLNPSTGGQGFADIPPVCLRIAQEIFGPEGADSLRDAYQQVGQVTDYYYSRAESFLFTTQDGRTLTRLEDIGRYMEEEGRKGNVEAISVGMDFMITHGFATQVDKDFALKMISQFKERGGVDFDVCAADPRSCYDYIHDDFRDNFDIMDQVFKILEEKMGFDPRLCEERGEFDDAIGQQCLEGARRALPILEALAVQNPEVKFFIEEIKGHIARGDDSDRRRDEFRTGGFVGPGGCDSENKCAAYCSVPENGPECLAFGISHEYAGFEGDEGLRRYQEYDYNINRPVNGDFYGPEQPYYGPDPYYPGPDPYYPQPYYPPGPGSGDECFEAIKLGDFVRAKEVCAHEGPSGPDYPAYNGPGYSFVEMPRDRQYDDGVTYHIIVGDPEGIKSFSVNRSNGSDAYSGSSSCAREVFSGLTNLAREEFPLTYKIEDCDGDTVFGEVFAPFPDDPYIFCPQDVTVCPDGVTTVGRSGPYCEFECPYNTCPFSIETAYPAPCEIPGQYREIITDNFGCTSFGQCISSGEIPGPVTCNYNRICEQGEDNYSCPDDCGGVSPPGEFCNFNGVCDPGEYDYNCPSDCGIYPSPVYSPLPTYTPVPTSGSMQSCFYPNATIN